MNKKIIITTIISVILYTLLLMYIGIFGEELQTKLIIWSKFLIKYILIWIGFVATIYLPQRIYKALDIRKKEIYNRESIQKILNASKHSKELNDKILKYKEDN